MAGRFEYGFRLRPDGAGHGVTPQVADAGAKMAPVSANAGCNYAGRGLKRASGARPADRITCSGEYAVM